MYMKLKFRCAGTILKMNEKFRESDTSRRIRGRAALPHGPLGAGARAVRLPRVSGVCTFPEKGYGGCAPPASRERMLRLSVVLLATLTLRGAQWGEAKAEPGG